MTPGAIYRTLNLFLCSLRSNSCFFAIPYTVVTWPYYREYPKLEIFPNLCGCLQIDKE